MHVISSHWNRVSKFSAEFLSDKCAFANERVFSYVHVIKLWIQLNSSSGGGQRAV